MSLFQWPWLILPLAGALIGWLANVLAVRLIFRPHRPRNVLGLRLQGLVPRRRAELAARIAETVEREFISAEDIRAALIDPALIEAFRTDVDRRVEVFIRERFDALPELVRQGQRIQGCVIHVDRFGNLVTNIPGVEVTGRSVEVHIAGRRIQGLSAAYAAEEGLLALVGSHGLLEISVRDGSAAALLGVGTGEPVRVEFLPTQT